MYVSFASGALVTTATTGGEPSGTLFGVLAADVELSEVEHLHEERGGECQQGRLHC